MAVGQVPSLLQHPARDHVQVALVAAAEAVDSEAAVDLAAAEHQVVDPVAAGDHNLTEVREVEDRRFKKMDRV